MTRGSPVDVLRGVVTQPAMYGPPREAFAFVQGLVAGTARAEVDLHALWLRALFELALLRGSLDALATHEDVIRVATWALTHEGEWMAPSALPLDVLFVCGHRALIDDLRATWWAQRPLLARIARLLPGGVLVTGDAPGPDTWAYTNAAGLGLVRVVYTKHRRVRVERPGEQPVEHFWTAPEEPAPTTRAAWTELLHRRNRAMIDDLARKRTKAPALRIEGLALRCPWSETDGTGMTTRYAATKPGVFDRFDVETYREPGERLA